jgi:hypothetical protein
VLTESVGNFLFIGVWPLLGAAFMVFIFIESIPSLGVTVDLIGLGTLAAGLVPMAIYWAKGREYFVRRPIDLTGGGDTPAAPEEPSPDVVGSSTL